MSDEKIKIPSGFSRIKLWSDSVETFGLDWNSLPKVHELVDKCSYQNLENFSLKSVGIIKIYVLEESPIIKIEKLTLSKAFIELTRHTFLGNYLFITNETTENFKQCQKMVSSIPICKLKRPHDFSRLSEVAETIEKHQ